APSHIALATLAIEAGVRRVVVEKPLSVSVAACRQLAEVADRAGAMVVVDHGRRWSPDYRSIRAYIERGHIGAVRHVSVVGGAGGPRDGLAAAEIAIAAHLSQSRDHRPVALPLDGDDARFEVAFA